MEAALGGFRDLRKRQYYYALKDISFDIFSGEMVGIVGHNGAGKSTLLRLLGGVGRPDQGSICINGRIGALLDLGSSFHGDLTGRENTFVSAIVCGLSRQAVLNQFDEIVEFAELADYIDNPIRTYSTGMQMRLAFAIAVHSHPDVMLVDEFLSVGDLAFQAKCLRRITELKKQGCAIVLISHSPEQIKELCDRAIWLRHGQIVAQGEPEVVLGQYQVEMHAETERRTPNCPPVKASSGILLETNQNRFGSLEAEIQAVRLQSGDKISSGDPLHIEIDYFASQPILAPVINVSITRYGDGQNCLDTNTSAMEFAIEKLNGSGTIVLELDRLDLVQGKYFVNIGLFKEHWEYAYDYHWEAYPLLITCSVNTQGTMNPPGRWRMVR